MSLLVRKSARISTRIIVSPPLDERLVDDGLQTKANANLCIQLASLTDDLAERESLLKEAQYYRDLTEQRSSLDDAERIINYCRGDTALQTARNFNNMRKNLSKSEEPLHQVASGLFALFASGLYLFGHTKEAKKMVQYSIDAYSSLPRSFKEKTIMRLYSLRNMIKTLEGITYIKPAYHQDIRTTISAVDQACILGGYEVLSPLSYVYLSIY